MARPVCHVPDFEGKAFESSTLFGIAIAHTLRQPGKLLDYISATMSGCKILSK